MTMQYDVQAVHTDTNVALVTGPTRLKGYQIVSGGTAGELVFYDNASAASGAYRLVLHVSTNQAMGASVIPGEGIRFTNGIYVTLPTDTHLTIFYG
jgi:hypothetical protein